MDSRVPVHEVALTVDERGRLDGWSRGAADSLTGDDGDEFEGQDAAAFVAPADRETFAAVVDRARERGSAGPRDVDVLTTEGTVVHELTARRADASERDLVEITLAVVGDRSGHREGSEGFAEFAGVIAHDLRNPLNVIKGRLELARETTDLAHLDQAEEAVDRMDRLIDDVLTLARDGERTTETAAVHLGSLVRDDAWTGIEAEGASLETGDLPTVEGDHITLRRLFENLLRNALEHADGDVQITVGPLDDGVFYVADDGPGIPPADRERVFEEGYSDGDGTGLGLAIVRQIAREHGWTVRVTDGAAGGARFEFRPLSSATRSVDASDRE